MKEFKGTKGEWKVDGEFREPTIINESNQIIFTHSKSCFDDGDGLHKYYSHNKMIANAKLTASAPKLLKALIGLVNQIENEHCSEYIDDLQEKAKQAINKAL